MHPLHRQLAAGMRAAAAGGNDLLTNLVAYWPLEGSSPTTDVHGSYTLTTNGTLASDNSAPTGNGIELPSGTSYLQNNDDGLNNGTSSFVVSVWGNLHVYNVGDYGSFLVNRRNPVQNDSGGWALSTSSNSDWMAARYFYDSTNFVLVSTATRPSTNVWNHYVMGFDAGTRLLSLYINGALVGTDNAPSAGTGQNSVNLRLGNWAWTSPDNRANWDGAIADCGYWVGRAPDQAMVDALYNSGNGLAYGSFQ
jgi:hypothetical protein